MLARYPWRDEGAAAVCAAIARTQSRPGAAGQAGEEWLLEEARDDWHAAGDDTKSNFSKTPKAILVCGQLLRLRRGIGVGNLAELDTVHKSDEGADTGEEADSEHREDF